MAPRQHAADSSQSGKLRALRLSYSLRAAACLLLLALYGSLFGVKGPDSPVLLGFILLHTLVYPHLCYLFIKTRQQDQYFVLVDAFLYGTSVGIMGLNPYLLAVVLIGNTMTNLASGGLPFFAKGLVCQLIGGLIGFSCIGFEFRETIPLFGLLISSIALMLYTSFLALSIFTVNHRLVQNKKSLKQRSEKLSNVNELALAVNRHLDLDSIMQAMMETFQRIYPFETLFVVKYSLDRNFIKIEGAYGSVLNENEVASYKQMEFDVAKDRNSIFVSSLEENRIIKIPYLTPEWVSKGSEVDQALYQVKPSHSIYCFPIYVDGCIEGGVSFINYHQPLSLNETDIDNIQEYLVQVGNAIKNLRMYDAANHAKLAAQKSEKAKSSFLANMSHEIRTPMTAIIGYSEILLDKTISAQDRESYINTVINSGKHLLSVINDILDVSKIESEKVQVELRDIALPSFITELNEYAQLHSKDKNLAYECKVHYPIPASICSDATRLKQILFNLINNGVKFTEQGFVKLEVAYHDQKLYFYVKDSGIGLSFDEQQRIFSEFTQADNSTTRLYGGTGLGLYISKNLAKLLHGDLSVESKSLEGSCFTFFVEVGSENEFTLIRNQQEFDGYVTNFKSHSGHEEVPIFEGQVLVAEDNLVNQKIIHRLLTGAGLEVTLVNNGEDAIDYSRAGHYDLILMDMQMPILGGEDATKIIREENNIPIIAFTANVMSDQVSRYLEAGFNAVLAKPIDQTKLYELLRVQLSREKHNNGVLIVEDNPVNQNILKRMVSVADPMLAITVLDNGQEAVNLLARQNFDLVFMDEKMPVLNGLGAIEKSRRNGYQGAIYLMLEPHEVEQKSLAKDKGASGCLFKPLDKENVIKLIHMNS